MRRLRMRLGGQQYEFASHCRRRRPFPASPSDGSTTKFRKVGVNLGNNNNPTVHQPVYIVDADTASLQHHHPQRSSGSHEFEFGSNNFLRLARFGITKGGLSR
jgi:hypothetical protein